MSIPYGKQTISKADIKAVVDTLTSEYLTTGPKIKEFEEKFAKLVNVRYAVAVSSGTAALHLACLAAGLKQGDELITSPMTFAASANCALYCGAKPVFVDIKENGLIDEELIEQKITSKTRIIIPVHYTGLPCNMKRIKTIANKHKLIVIEDACHALGSKYDGTKIGDCTYSDVAVFSFHPVKHITTGEGGMITTNSKITYEKLLLLRTHGVTKDPNKLFNKHEGPWFYEMQELGFNYRLADFQCALGISQLDRVGEFIRKRIVIAKTYDKAFSKIKGIEIIRPIPNCKNTYHLYVIKVKDKVTRLKLFNYLRSNNIFCQVHYIPVYWHPFYRRSGYKKGICPKAEQFYARIISIPIYPELKNNEQQMVIKAIEDFFGETGNIHYSQDKKVVNVDKLVLGTVQLGLDYGINNSNGKPSREKSLAILDYAWKKGIRTFDTAYAYGEAEEILGEFIKTNKLGKKIKIITKLKPNILLETSDKIAAGIESNLKESLRRLNINSVDGYLLHTPKYIYDKKVINTLVSLKKKGLIKNIGVSIYEKEDAIFAAGLARIDYIQIPYNILDQRLDNKTFWDLTRKNKIVVFARSAFLQGLFFMPEKRIPAHLQKVKKYFREIDEIVGRNHLTRLQAALLFSYCNNNIDHVVFGVDNIDQLKEDLEIIKNHLDCDKCITELKDRFINIEKSIIFPSLWKK